MPWRVYRPAVVVGHSETGEMDKVDGPYYFFPLFKRLRDTPAGLAAAGRRRPRRHQRRAGRLRRQGDGPHRPPARSRRPGVPPGQPRAAAHRRAGQHVRGRRQGAAVRGPGGPPGHRRAADQRCCPARCARRARPEPAAHAARPAAARARRSAGSASRPRCSSTSPSRRSSRPGAPSGRWPAPASPAPTSRGTPRRCGPTGRSTSTRDTARDSRDRRAARAAGTVVITGASSGIGKVVALKVAQAGGVPILVARGKDKLEDTKAEIESARRHARTSTPATSPTWRRSTRCASSCSPSTTTHRLRGQQRRPLDPAVAARCRRTGSTTSSAPCS